MDNAGHRLALHRQRQQPLLAPQQIHRGVAPTHGQAHYPHVEQAARPLGLVAVALNLLETTPLTHSTPSRRPYIALAFRYVGLAPAPFPPASTPTVQARQTQLGSECLSNAPFPCATAHRPPPMLNCLDKHAMQNIGWPYLPPMTRALGAIGLGRPANAPAPLGLHSATHQTHRSPTATAPPHSQCSAG